MKKTVNGVQYNTENATRLMAYIVREKIVRPPDPPPFFLTEPTIGFERLYRSEGNREYWLHKGMHPQAPGGASDAVMPITEQQAHAWLKDRFGWWKRFDRIFEQVFAPVEQPT